jgi:hypothetical protein
LCVEENNVLSDARAACDLDQRYREAERFRKLALLRLDPGLAGPVGLVLVQREHLRRLHGIPNRSDLRTKDVIQARGSWFQPAVGIEENNAPLLPARG